MRVYFHPYDSSKKERWIVEYPGVLFQKIKREFESLERAEQWARQVGKYGTSKIRKAEP